MFIDKKHPTALALWNSQQGFLGKFAIQPGHTILDIFILLCACFSIKLCVVLLM